MRLGCATFTELLGRVDIHLLIPLGATEQHGPHLPLNTDTLIASSVAEAVAAARDDVVVAPALPYGSSGEHSGFPGTLSLGQAALETTLVELVRSAAGFRDVTLLSWHGGNAEPVARTIARLRAEGRRVHLWAAEIRPVFERLGRTRILAVSIRGALGPCSANRSGGISIRIVDENSFSSGNLPSPLIRNKNPPRLKSVHESYQL